MPGPVASAAVVGNQLEAATLRKCCLCPQKNLMRAQQFGLTSPSVPFALGTSQRCASPHGGSHQEDFSGYKQQLGSGVGGTDTFALHSAQRWPKGARQMPADSHELTNEMHIQKLKKAALTATDLASSEGAVLLDFQAEGAPLVIAFASFNPEVATPPYEFFGRLKKLESISKQPINKLLLRDPVNNWYHHGIPGLGADSAEAAARLQGLVSALNPSSVMTLGQSMGAYAAILYGALINADQALAFGSLAYFDSSLLRMSSDYRWMDVVQRVEAAPPKHFFKHLPSLLDRLDIKTRVQLFYGTKPIEANLDLLHFNEAVNHDAVHALMLAQSARVVPHPLRWSVHRVPAYLRAAGFIDEFMAHWLLGAPYAPEATDDLGPDASWINWMSENYRHGFDAERLLPQTLGNLLLPEKTIEAAFNAVRRNVLREVL